MTYFTLNAHKKCIGQSNFNPLLYYNINGDEKENLIISLPGTYTIKYVSGAIYSFNYKILLLSLSAKNIDYNQQYWNRYYETPILKLGNYDISYFPGSSILLGCFQCQFGTLPGFTKLGYTTRQLANTMNSLYYNNSKYSFNDVLTFTTTLQLSLVFWYTNNLLQCVLGSITYSLDYNILSLLLQLFYLNDISILTVNKQNYNKETFENYSYNKDKENLKNLLVNSAPNVWISNLSTSRIIKNISDFNTLGYASAYLNNLIYSDTINYNKQYSDLYHWDLIKATKSKYKFIGKFSSFSNSILLYEGIYTIFLSDSSDYIFSKNNILLNVNCDNCFNTNDLLGKSIFIFKVTKICRLRFNNFLKKNKSIYMYEGNITLLDLNTYILNIKDNTSFVKTFSLTDLPSGITLFKSQNKLENIHEYNEINYIYYIDAINYITSVLPSTFYIYANINPINDASFGPFNSLSAASAQLSASFNLNLNDYICTEITGIYDTHILSYVVSPKKGNN